MANVAIVYFSGYGHTAKQAGAVQEGAAGAGAAVSVHVVDKDGEMPEGTWEALAAADAIVMGSPTYMGGVAWQFKKFADASSKPWFSLAWKDKLGAGFTNSASINGDKNGTLDYLFHLAMQHGMVWAGTAILPSNKKDAGRDDLNWLGSFSGLMAQSPADSSPDEGPLPGDLATARAFGARVAGLAARLRG